MPRPLRSLDLCCVLLLLIAGNWGWTARAINDPDSIRKAARDNPQSLVRTAVRKELADSYGLRQPLRYRIRKISEHLDTTKEIVETKEGGVACLVAMDGRPLTPNAIAVEHARLEKLRSSPSLQEHRRIREQDDAAHMENLLRVLPEAFRYQYVGLIPTAAGPAFRLAFEPNPHFSPPGYEARALRGMRGEMWIDQRQQRIVRFDAHLFRDVDFGWGILGYVDKGGGLLIEQKKVADSMWTLAKMQLSVTGRALMVKSIKIAVEETATDYQKVPDNFTYQQAIDLLLHENCGATSIVPARVHDQRLQGQHLPDQQ